MRRAGLALVATLLLVVSAAAQPGRDGATRVEYRGTGVVLAILPPPSDLHASRPVIIIEHEPIAGLMDERMSMPFIAASTTLFQGLTPGDRIAFGLKDTPGALLVIFVDRLDGGPRTGPPIPPTLGTPRETRGAPRSPAGP